MSKPELLKILRQLAKSTDTETAHVAADDAVLTYLNDREIATAYRRITKWYA
jgi:hypothetical protein